MPVSTHVQVSFCHADAKSASCWASGGGLGSVLHCPSQVVPLYVPFTIPRVMQTAYGSPSTLLTLRLSANHSQDRRIAVNRSSERLDAKTRACAEQ